MPVTIAILFCQQSISWILCDHCNHQQLNSISSICAASYDSVYLLRLMPLFRYTIISWRWDDCHYYLSPVPRLTLLLMAFLSTITDALTYIIIFLYIIEVVLFNFYYYYHCCWVYYLCLLCGIWFLSRASLLSTVPYFCLLLLLFCTYLLLFILYMALSFLTFLLLIIYLLCFAANISCS